MLPKIRCHFSKKCGLKLIFFNEKKKKYLEVFWPRKLTLNVQFSCNCAMLALQISKNHFATCNLYFCKKSKSG